MVSRLLKVKREYVLRVVLRYVVVAEGQELRLVEVWKLFFRQEDLNLMRLVGILGAQLHWDSVALLLANPASLRFFDRTWPPWEVVELLEHFRGVLDDVEVPLVHLLPLSLGA